MTVSAQVPINTAVYAGSPTFNYSFLLLSSNDLIVSVNGVTKAIGADYIVSGVGIPAGGSVTFLTTLLIGQVVVLRRSTTLQRTTDYQANGDFKAVDVNADYDRIWMALQETSQSVSSRSLRLPPGETAADLPNAATRAGYLLSFDSLGTPVLAAPVAGSATALAVSLSLAAGSTLIGWIRIAANAIATTVSKWISRQNISLHDFMTDAQIADSQLLSPVLDHTAAIQVWLAQAGPLKALYLPTGKFRCNALLTAPLVSGIKIYGDGRQASQLMYFGAATGDILTFGDGTTAISRIELRDFNIDSETAMISGHGLHIKKAVSGGANISNVSLGQLNATKKLWNGIRFTNCNVCYYVGWEINVQAECIVAVGDVAADTGSDLTLDLGTAVGGTVGIHLGGGFGGLYVGACLFYGQSDTGYRQDSALVARANREVVLSPQSVFDAANSQLIHINETFGTNACLSIGSFVTGAGFFTASPGDGIYIQSMPSGRVSISSPQIKSNKRHGIRVEDASCYVETSSSTYVTDNLGYGFFSSIALSNVENQAKFLFNTSGDINANIQEWKSAAITLSSSAGSLGAYAATIRYKKTASLIFFNLAMNITANNTASGSLLAFLPFQARTRSIFIGESENSFKSTVGRLTAGTGNAQIFFADGTYPGASGDTIYMNGVVECY